MWASRRNETADSGATRQHYDALAPDYDAQANQACKRAYAELLARVAPDAQRILEIGAGSGMLLAQRSAPLRVACDLSFAMLAARKGDGGVQRVTADAQRLPFRDASFDLAFSVNLLEHVPDPQRVAGEASRLLMPGGTFLGITPNGNVAWLLELLERLHLKLPEGPHRFLTYDEMAALKGEAFELLECRRFIACPAGPPTFVRWVDARLRRGRGSGLFHYVLLRKRR